MTIVLPIEKNNSPFCPANPSRILKPTKGNGCKSTKSRNIHIWLTIQKLKTDFDAHVLAFNYNSPLFYKSKKKNSPFCPANPSRILKPTKGNGCKSTKSRKRSAGKSEHQRGCLFFFFCASGVALEVQKQKKKIAPEMGERFPIHHSAQGIWSP
ncbi:hypothetical protein CDAR_383561 [Caerostris darwini]|uniref:Uncharacterized protein n=1 Tax=Caerostris darwini TaxID=1538125 RepID=A0AAV4TA08_9ARAC|nr:hypothetical protein CDAR_383561 [Caerostris darwini]